MLEIKSWGEEMQWRWNYFFVWFGDDLAGFIVSRK